ncbi:hypothetical protein ACP4OV_021464 [Aristida adscensionis]
MLHRWNSGGGGGGGGGSHQSIAGPAAMASTTFSLFFPMPKAQWPEAAAEYDDDHSSITTSASSPSSSSSTGSVDCTLSLGTPSSRRAAEPELVKHVAPAAAAYPSASPATLSWDVPADQPAYYCQGSRPAAGAAKAGAGHDLLLDRRCANCGTSSTPLWRNGPCGPKSLCNACGIRFKKEERRAALMAAMESGAGAGAGCGYSAQRSQYGSAARAPGAAAYGGGDADADASFLAWRLNVVAPAPAPAFAVWPERASLFQYN